MNLGCARSAVLHLAVHACPTRTSPPNPPSLPPLQAAEAAELRKFEEAKRRALEQKAVQTQQLEELKARILAERAENKREGELLRTRALQVRGAAQGICCSSGIRRVGLGLRLRGSGGREGRRRCAHMHVLQVQGAPWQGLACTCRARQERMAAWGSCGRSGLSARAWCGWWQQQLLAPTCLATLCMNDPTNGWSAQEADEMRAKELARIAKAKQLNEETKEANRVLQVRPRAHAWHGRAVAAGSGCLGGMGLCGGGVGSPRPRRRTTHLPLSLSPSPTFAGLQAQGAGAAARAGGGH